MDLVVASSAESTEAEWIVTMTGRKLKEIYNSVNQSDARRIILQQQGVSINIKRGVVTKKRHAVYNVRCFLMRLRMKLISGERPYPPTCT